MVRSTLIILFATLLMLPVSAYAQSSSPMPMHVERTANFTFTLDIVPSEDMAPDVTTDQGMAVNHHLELHIMHADDNMLVTDVTPVIRITDKSSGVSRDLPHVMGMTDPEMGMADFHYGQNLWLPDGTYLVTVMVGSDTAQFRDIQVVGSPMMMETGNSMGQSHEMAMAPGIARDGQMFSQQSASVQALFTAVWGDMAADEWAKEHNAGLPAA